MDKKPTYEELEQRIRVLEEKSIISKRMEEEIALIAEIGRIISSTLDIDEVYERFAAEIKKMILMDRLSINLKREKTHDNEFRVAYAYGTAHAHRQVGNSVALRGTATAEVIDTRKALLLQLADAREIEKRFPHIAESFRSGLRSMMVIPLISGDEGIGSLVFGSEQLQAYTLEDLHLAERIGNQIAGAIANAQLFAELKREENEKALIAELGRTIGSSLNIEEVYERLADEVVRLIPYNRLIIHLRQPPPHDDEYKFTYLYGTENPDWKLGESRSLEGTSTGAVVKNRTGMIFQKENVEEIMRYPRLYNSFKRGIRSTLTVPLISKDEVIGVITFRSQKDDAYNKDALRFAERIGLQIAPAIVNAHLFADLKHQEKSLRESESLFRAIFEQAAVGVAEIDLATGRFLRVNRRDCEILGMTEEEILATSYMAVTHPEDCLLLANKLTQVMDGEINSVTVEKRCIRKDGIIIWVNIAVAPLWKAAEGTLNGIMVIEDITDRKNLELELRNTLNKLESRFQERTIEMEKINTALGVLLEKRENDKKDLEEVLQANVDQLVMPFLQKLRANQWTKESIAYFDILETNLKDITSPFIKYLSTAYKALTPKEIQIAELIRQGKNSKDIAKLFGLSVGTVITHRNNIRKKLKLKSKDTNLRAYLLLLR